MRVLNTAGLRGVEKLIGGAAVPGLAPAGGNRIPRRREWVAQPPASGAQLGLVVASHQSFKYVSVTWTALPTPPRTARARELKRVQDEFYARYMAAGQRAYATPPRRISDEDRRILLVGELEADVNNGGFGQYVLNKGRRRAAAALRVLDDIGAAKIAALLRAALAASGDEALQALDSKFYGTRQDLAVLMMTHLSSSSRPSRD